MSPPPLSFEQAFGLFALGKRQKIIKKYSACSQLLLFTRSWFNDADLELGMGNGSKLESLVFKGRLCSTGSVPPLPYKKGLFATL